MFWHRANLQHEVFHRVKVSGGEVSGKKKAHKFRTCVFRGQPFLAIVSSNRFKRSLSWPWPLAYSSLYCIVTISTTSASDITARRTPQPLKLQEWFVGEYNNVLTSSKPTAWGIPSSESPGGEEVSGRKKGPQVSNLRLPRSTVSSDWFKQSFQAIAFMTLTACL